MRIDHASSAYSARSILPAVQLAWMARAEIGGPAETGFCLILPLRTLRALREMFCHRVRFNRMARAEFAEPAETGFCLTLPLRALRALREMFCHRVRFTGIARG